MLSFLSWLLLPAAQFSENEKRPLSQFPELSTAKSSADFMRKFDTYYQDHFGFREWMIRRYQREVSKRFGESGMVYVVEGKDGWLFYAAEGVMEDFQGKLRFSEQELQRFCDGLQAKHDWLTEQGILYIPLIAPNKQSIYQDKMQNALRALEGERTRFDQVLESCPKGLLYDLRPVLQEQRLSERGYAKTDTHWNEKGALHGYTYLMDRVEQHFPGFEARRQFSFAQKPSETKGGDLAVLLGREEEMKEDWPVLPPFEVRVKRAPIGSELQQLLTIPQLQPELHVGHTSSLRLLVLHDSFFNTLKPYTSINFANALYVWQFYDKEAMAISGPATLQPLIERFEPDVVVEEIVERHLEMMLESVDYEWGSLQ